MDSLREKLEVSRAALEAFRAADTEATAKMADSNEAWTRRHECWEAWLMAAQEVDEAFEAEGK